MCLCVSVWVGLCGLKLFVCAFGCVCLFFVWVCGWVYICVWCVCGCVCVAVGVCVFVGLFDVGVCSCLWVCVMWV